MKGLHQLADHPPRAATTAAVASTSPAVLIVVGGLSLVAAAIHLTVAPEHLQQWAGYGAFFIATAIFELGLVLALAIRPSQLVVEVGVWATLTTMLMYFVSRTAGVPLGPEAGAIEDIEPLGVIATVAEAAIVVTLCTLLAGPLLRRTTGALALVGALLWLAAAGGYLSPPRSPQAASHRNHGGAAHAKAERALPRIPDRVRYAPRPPGIG